MVAHFLDGRLLCPNCSTTTFDIPADTSEHSSIACSNCGQFLGLWGDLLNEFYKQDGTGVFEVQQGRFFPIK
jgi:hypothetical protein